MPCLGPRRCVVGVSLYKTCPKLPYISRLCASWRNPLKGYRTEFCLSVMPRSFAESFHEFHDSHRKLPSILPYSLFFQFMQTCSKMDKHNERVHAYCVPESTPILNRQLDVFGQQHKLILKQLQCIQFFSSSKIPVKIIGSGRFHITHMPYTTTYLSN